MYDLFELKRILSVGQSVTSTSIEITHSAYIEGKNRSILVIVCSNGKLLFRTTSITEKYPVIHSVEWFNHSQKEIRAITFDGCGNWLLVAVRDGTLYLVPTIKVQGQSPKGTYNWRNDDVTEIRVSGQRGNPTCLCWWHSFDGRQIAIVGNELGEIAFVNLKTRKEAGGIYVTVGIENFELIQDEPTNTTCLLITGNTKQQFHLLLEDKKNAFFLLAEAEPESGLEGIERRMWQLQDNRPLFIEDKKYENQPRRLSRYEGGATLFQQTVKGQSYVVAYTKSSGTLQLLNCKLESLGIPTYHVPFEARSLLVMDRLFYIIKAPKDDEEEDDDGSLTLSVVACQSIENLRKQPKENANPLLQEFKIGSDLVNMHALRPTSKLSGQHFASLEEKKISLPPEVFLNGCILVHKTEIYECRQKCSLSELFLSHTVIPSSLPLAERLGVLLSLDIHKLYEAGAELQLSQGQFAQAVRLYQLSKSPQLKRVAHFVSYGYLSELIAYIQVLFSTKGPEISTADKAHFANIALHCFVQQVLDRKQERPAVLQAFKDFLRENQYYDDEVAIRLLEEQGLYDLLYYCSQLRGQHRLMIEHLLATDSSILDALDKDTADLLTSRGFAHSFLKMKNDDYLSSVTCPSLLQHLASKPQLLRCHLQHVAQLLPSLSVPFLLNVARLYDPCHPAAGLAVRSVITSHSQKYFSMSSLSSISSDSLELAHSDEENVSEEDLIKFYIFVLLVLNHKRGPRVFDLKLMELETFQPTVSQPKQSVVDCPLACGHSHAALLRQQGVLFTWGKGLHGRLGHGEPFQEASLPTTVDLSDVQVTAVSCGHDHTLAITNHGIFAWGSSKYGQLGLGPLQRTTRPLLVESLFGEAVISVICGQYHSLAITSSGCIYSWGWGVHGQLGHGDSGECRLPKQIKFFSDKPVISASAGHGHTAVLTKQGEVYTFGCGMFGQLGQGTVVKNSTPQLVYLSEPVTQLASGYFHILALTPSNKLYVWGSHPQSLRLQAQTSRKARQLQQNIESGTTSQSPYGVSPHLSSSAAQAIATLQANQSHLLPTLVPLPNNCPRIAKLCAGSNHSMFLTIDGEVFTWGRNSEGQLGHGSRKEQKTPLMVLTLNDRQITQISCGNDFSLVLDSNHRLWGWGQNDCSQLGEKPSSPESRSRSTILSGSSSFPVGSVVSTSSGSGSSTSSRVITIKTNRRVLTITQNCRRGEVRPVEIHTLPPINNNLLTTKGNIDFDLNSFESDFTVQKVDYQERRRENTAISKEDHTYGPKSLHTALKVFHRFYDSTSILNHCVSFCDMQAAAKICILEGLYAQALDNQLQALDSSLPVDPDLRQIEMVAIEILHFYINFLDKNNCEANRQFLEHMVGFWVKHNLCVEQLELFLGHHLNNLAYPLGLLLFCNHSTKKGVAEQLLPRLSTDFCLDVSETILTCIDSGSQHPELLDHLVTASDTASLLRQLHQASDGLSGWESALPTHALWQEVLHNFQKGSLSRCSLHLSTSGVELLTKALVSERTHPGTPASIMGDDIVAFTCGHHYTLKTFKNCVLPGFQDALRRLPCPLPQTERLLMQGYQMEGLLPTACPPCVLTEIKNQF